jgi:hypothetical protein
VQDNKEKEHKPKYFWTSLTVSGVFQFFTDSITLGLGLIPSLHTTCPK